MIVKYIHTMCGYNAKILIRIPLMISFFKMSDSWKILFPGDMSPEDTLKVLMYYAADSRLEQPLGYSEYLKFIDTLSSYNALQRGLISKVEHTLDEIISHFELLRDQEYEFWSSLFPLAMRSETPKFSNLDERAQLYISRAIYNDVQRMIGSDAEYFDVLSYVEELKEYDEFEAKFPEYLRTRGHNSHDVKDVMSDILKTAAENFKSNNPKEPDLWGDIFPLNTSLRRLIKLYSRDDRGDREYRFPKYVVDSIFGGVVNRLTGYNLSREDVAEYISKLQLYKNLQELLPVYLKTGENQFATKDTIYSIIKRAVHHFRNVIYNRDGIDTVIESIVDGIQDKVGCTRKQEITEHVRNYMANCSQGIAPHIFYRLAEISAPYIVDRYMCISNPTLLGGALAMFKRAKNSTYLPVLKKLLPVSKKAGEMISAAGLNIKDVVTIDLINQIVYDDAFKCGFKPRLDIIKEYISESSEHIQLIETLILALEWLGPNNMPTRELKKLIRKLYNKLTDKVIFKIAYI